MCKCPSKIAEDMRANFTEGPFIYYVITFLGFLDPPPPYVSMFLVLRISKNWHFLTPPSPPTSADVIYEWSPMRIELLDKREDQKLKIKPIPVMGKRRKTSLLNFSEVVDRQIEWMPNIL